MLTLTNLDSNDDLNKVASNVSTVIDLLEDKGISWGEYQEDMVLYSHFPGPSPADLLEAVYWLSGYGISKSKYTSKRLCEETQPGGDL